MVTAVEYENQVYEAIERMGQVTRSDAQALVEALEAQGKDFIEVGRSEQCDPSEVAYRILESEPKNFVPPERRRE